MLTLLILTTGWLTLYYAPLQLENQNTEVVTAIDLGVSSPDTPPSMAAGAVQQDEGAYVQMQDGVVRFYFGLNADALPAGTDEALSYVVTLAQMRQKKLAIGRPHITQNESGQKGLATLNQRRVQAMQQAARTLGLAGSQIQILDTSVEAEAVVDPSRTHIDVWVMN